MLLILLAAAGVSALTGALAGESEWAETIIILVVVLLNAVLGVLQESKAEAAIEALRNHDRRDLQGAARRQSGRAARRCQLVPGWMQLVLLGSRRRRAGGRPASSKAPP